MPSRILAAALAAGCLTAAAGGAYVAVRHNGTAPAAATGAPGPAPGLAGGGVAAPAATPAPQPVSETEAVVEAPAPAPPPAAAQPPAAEPPVHRKAPDSRRARPTPPGPAPTVAASRQPAPAPGPRPERDTDAVRQPQRPAVVQTAERTVPTEAAAAPAREPEPVRAPEPRQPVHQYQEIVLPASSILGLRVDTPLSSERSRLEDRVDARVSRDVTVDGRVAIPSGSRVIGSVTLVERGGKMKERARLGVRFHTLVLADGREMPLRTETIMRDGDSPASESARKIGGAAIGGAILGAIIGGGKGAVLGGATGAAGGSAAVMTGNRNAATLPAGTVVSVRLSSPASIEVERPQQ